jgi:hypothetical protein
MSLWLGEALSLPELPELLDELDSTGPNAIGGFVVAPEEEPLEDDPVVVVSADGAVEVDDNGSGGE